MPIPNYEALNCRVTNGGIFVCKLHYAADEFKNPANEQGKLWLKQALSGYAMGIEDPNWLKEMEIKYTAGSGTRVFPYWEHWKRGSNIFIEGEVDVTDAKLYGSYDHGYANPAAYLVHALYPDSLRRTIWEFYGDKVPVQAIAKIIRGETLTLEDGRTFEGNPYASQEVMRICDPEIHRRTQVSSQGPYKSVAELFSKEGVHFVKGDAGDDMTVASWLLGNLWIDPDNPTYQIHRRCVNLIWELGRLQRKSWSPLQQATRNKHEALLDKDNHAWDALKYWMKRFPVGTPLPTVKKPQADFAWWRDRKKNGIKASYVREQAR